ncbi:Cro/CI family transcriptional regulator [Methylobacterium radiotolerans]|jgi:DNA-binding transcriptional regulator YdaS (Cro superfamily)|uniref:transcriptional regulator n=1 Tax=Methylobacterium TaxID=407 RepID=UPI0005DFEC86|nr:MULTISPECIES: Cro/CI family transcriptional regulator [Methylobacterium]GAN49669.1 hypothetical protein ME121_3700 [Methylobacterium sp. ME121]
MSKVEAINAFSPPPPRCDANAVDQRQLMREALNRAVRAVRFKAALARAIGISTQAVDKWDVVPAERVLKVEEITGVSRHDLRPDVFGPAPEEIAARSEFASAAL